MVMKESVVGATLFLVTTTLQQPHLGSFLYLIYLRSMIFLGTSDKQKDG